MASHIRRCRRDGGSQRSQIESSRHQKHPPNSANARSSRDRPKDAVLWAMSRCRSRSGNGDRWEAGDARCHVDS